MKQNINKLGYLIGMELKIKKKSLIIWIISLCGIMTMYMAMFPVIKTVMTEEMLSAFPEEIISIFLSGGLLNMSNYNSYFAMIYEIILTIICGYAIYSSANAINEEEHRGTIEFTYSLSITRLNLVMAKLASILINITCMFLSVGLIANILGAIVAKDSVNFGAIAIVMLTSYAVICSFVGIGFLIASLCSKKIKAPSVALGVFFGMYALGYAAGIGADSLAFLRWLSPIDMVSLSNLVQYNLGMDVQITSDGVGVVSTLLIAMVSMTIAAVRYTKKDFN